MFRLLLITLLVSTALAGNAYAESKPQSLGVFGSWHTFMVTENRQPVCYMSLTNRPSAQTATPSIVDKWASKKPTKPIKRGDALLMITHRPSEGSKDVVSYSAGTKLKPASEAKILIGKKEFDLFTQNDTAWSRDAATDHALAVAIKDASSMTFNGETVKEEPFADTISIKGAGQAYKAISKACGIPVEEDKPKVSTPAKPVVKSVAQPATTAKKPTTGKKPAQ